MGLLHSFRRGHRGMYRLGSRNLENPGLCSRILGTYSLGGSGHRLKPIVRTTSAMAKETNFASLAAVSVGSYR